jgi:hypothetical protein
MQCRDTDSHQVIRIEMPVDLARDISSLINSIKALGGNGRITLEMFGGNVISTEIAVKRQRTKKTT